MMPTIVIGLCAIVRQKQSTIFFLEYAGEMHIFVLSRRKTIPYKYHYLTPDEALRGWELHRRSLLN
jgi:hypothetical protein